MAVAGHVAQTYSMQVLMAYCPLFFIPVLAAKRLSFVTQTLPSYQNVDSMYLMRNGDYVLIRTMSGSWTKLQLSNVEGYNIHEKRDQFQYEIHFETDTLTVNTSNAEIVDFELLDKIVRGISVEWVRSGLRSHRRY